MSRWLAGVGKGMLVPDNAVGRVHSVFDRACNVALHDGQWLSLLDSTLASAPLAIRLDVSGDFRQLFHPAEPFSIKAGVWRSSRCRGDVAGLPICAPVAPRQALPTPLIEANLDRVDAELSAWQRSHPAERPTADLHALVGALADAIAQRDTRALGAIARRLVGNGKGLTPSGDDVLTGCLAALWRLSSLDRSVQPLLSTLRITLPGLLHRTTEVSRHYLGLAISNLFAQPLDELRQHCLALPDEMQLRGACQRALHVGSSSGFDGVSGLAMTYRTALALPGADKPVPRPMLAQRSALSLAYLHPCST